MTKLKLKFIVFLSLVCAGLAIAFLVSTNSNKFATVSAQQNEKTQSNDGQRKKSLKVDKSTDIIDEATKPTSASERVKREEKNRRYDKKIGTGKIRGRLTDFESNQGVTVSSNDPDQLPRLPVVQSEIIVSGTINEAQPYLTESEEAIYTEFSFQIENVLKNNADKKISQSDSIKVDQEGGAMRFANGKTIHYDIAGKDKLPRVGKKYVLFLKYINDGNDLVIVKNYELRNGKVFAPEEMKVFSPDTGIVIKKSPFANLAEADFLQIIRNTIVNPESASNKGGSNQ